MLVQRLERSLNPAATYRGGKPKECRQDTERVWHEHQPVCARQEFDAGRSAWAKTFLKRHSIFHTQYFRHLEEQARKNLQALV